MGLELSLGLGSVVRVSSQWEGGSELWVCGRTQHVLPCREDVWVRPSLLPLCRLGGSGEFGWGWGREGSSNISNDEARG